MNNNILDEFRYAFVRPDNGLIKIILINASVFVLLTILNVIFTLSKANDIYQLILEQLMLPASLPSFIYRPWTLVTYFFVHTGFFHILFNMLFLYWFGRIINEFLGSEKIVNLYVLGGLAGGVFYMLIYNLLPYFSDQVEVSVLLGASAGVFAIVVGAATFMPNYTLSFILIGPVKIKYIALVYVFMSFAQSAGSNAGGELAHLAGAAVGFIFINQMKKGNDLGQPVTQFFDFVRSLFISQPKVKVSYRNTEKRTSTANRKRSAGKHYTQDEIDAILDKISEKGYDSLTKEEKQKLFDASRKE